MHFQPIEPSGGDDYVAMGGGVEGTVPEAAAQQVDVATSYDPLDDVFGTNEETTQTLPSDGQDGSHHPSDMHRLETEHTTAGYREGVTIAKEKTVQAGFDEGFSLGASIGRAAGQVIGILEGIEEALEKHNMEEASKMKSLLAQAREELSVAKIFGQDYWAADGNWRYDVYSAAGEDVLFADVASWHPLIRRWTAVANDQIKLWKVDMTIMEGEQEVQRQESLADEPTVTVASTTSKRALDW